MKTDNKIILISGILIASFLVLYFCRSNFLSYAIDTGDISVIKFLTDLGADINTPDKQGETPLIKACKNGNIEAVNFLISKGADVNITDKNGESILLSAIKKGNPQMALALVDAGANINVTDKNKDTLLNIAIKKGDLAIVKVLLEKGADVNAKDKEGKTPIFYALSKDKVEILKLLIEKGADVNAEYTYPYRFRNGEEKIIKETLLLTAWGSSVRNEETLVLLVENGANIDDVKTFLDNAVNNKYFKLIKTLAKRKEGENPDKPSLLGVVFQQRDPVLLQTLINYGADVNAENYGEPLLLHAIASQFHPMDTEMVLMLIENGADINIKDNEFGNTPLIKTMLYAKDDKNNKIAKLLIKKGADVNAKNILGNTALKIAQKSKNQEMIKLLKQAGAK